MKITMLVPITGTPTANRGEVIDLPDDEAQRFIDAEFAVAGEIDLNAQYETAMANAAPERAQGRTARRG